MTRREENEEDVNRLGIKNGQEMATDGRKYRTLILEAKAHNGL